MNLLFSIGIAFSVLIILLVYSLCRVSKRSDELMEKLNRLTLHERSSNNESQTKEKIMEKTLNTNQVKKLFSTPAPEMTAAQGTVLKTAGNQIAGLLEGIEGKVAPEFYDIVERASIHFYSQVNLAVNAGWKGNFS